MIDIDNNSDTSCNTRANTTGISELSFITSGILFTYRYTLKVTIKNGQLWSVPTINFNNLISENVSSSVTSVHCEMCSNYECQLLNAQEKIHDLEKHIISLERYKQELSKETAFRKDMEEKWNEKKEEYKEQVHS